MKKTSRRSFGKQLTGAIAALPVVSLAMNSEAGGQTDKQTKPRTRSVTSNRSSHDTPPPVLLMSGSLIIEARTDKGHDWTKYDSDGNRFKHKVPIHDKDGNPPSGNIRFGHIKIVDGSGEMVYRLDNDYKDPITVTAFMSKDKTEFVTLTVDGINLVIGLPDKRKLEQNASDPSMDPPDPLDPKPEDKRRQRVRYKDTGGNEGKINHIEVSSNEVVLYGLKVDGYKAAKELRVMIWWEV